LEPGGWQQRGHRPVHAAARFGDLDTFLGGSSDTCINRRGVAYANSHIIPENSNTPIIANGGANKAIFAFSWGVWTNQVHGGNSSVLGALDNFNPTFNAIQNGAYPWGRFLYYFTDIQNTIIGSGFVPLVLGTINGGDTNRDYCRLIVS
jgi:hypothetical protein